MSSLLYRVKDKCIKADYISSPTTTQRKFNGVLVVGSLHDMEMTKSKVWSFVNDPGGWGSHYKFYYTKYM